MFTAELIFWQNQLSQNILLFRRAEGRLTSPDMAFS